MLSEEHIGELIEAISEDFSSKQLRNEKYMLYRLKFLLGYKDKEAQAILWGARELKKLRGDVKPSWAHAIQRH